jgi:hypothetical protein
MRYLLSVALASTDSLPNTRYTVLPMFLVRSSHFAPNPKRGRR